ncbi:hypothetical protein HYPSUDRAFT_52247 [Hypholoma sublateritium FD-334 SS-4]|uniref:(2E,6E)-farnesyl diphosphate synthase n=1 Tax=Hypholoma sublateritium (strain FD-334 SS-4) TaxID=945553 RepID=A0A0D2Q5D5_HYPSF|nr:hypothetical protein HYPSUDRAFT_52247 [Hypholoma sublateritium FD-334 SS-4]
MHRAKLVSRRLCRHSSSAASSSPDPFAPVAAHLTALRASLPALLSAGHPSITQATQYYFKHPSKQVRPLIVLLMAQATNGLGTRWDAKRTEAAELVAERRGADAGLDWPLTRPDVLNDWNPSQPRETERFAPTFSMQPPRGASRRHRVPPPPVDASTSPEPALAHTVLPTQLRLAQIVEMMHTASLLHDDVIDASALRRGAPSAPAAFGNKRAVLAGNFVLGRASVALARLGDPEATELIASVLANLVEGEILQLREVTGAHQDAWNVYLQKTYLKTASLMAKGARAAVVLGGAVDGEVWKEAAYAYGRNIGIAFQLVDDVLDYEAASAALGKPGGADLSLGLATAPALYACEEHPQMGALIARKFSGAGDVEEARDLVLRSAGVRRTRELAQKYADEAVKVLQALPPSEARSALEALAGVVTGRRS